MRDNASDRSNWINIIINTNFDAKSNNNNNNNSFTSLEFRNYAFCTKFCYFLCHKNHFLYFKHFYNAFLTLMLSYSFWCIIFSLRKQIFYLNYALALFWNSNQDQHSDQMIKTQRKWWSTMNSMIKSRMNNININIIEMKKHLLGLLEDR